MLQNDKSKNIFLALAIIFLFHPLLFFIRNGSLVGEVGGEPRIDLYTIYRQFSPISLVIGLVLLGFYLYFSVDKTKRILALSFQIIPAAISIFMVVSAVQYNNKISVFRYCVDSSLESRATGYFENTQKVSSCLDENKISYHFNEFGEAVLNSRTFFPFLQ